MVKMKKSYSFLIGLILVLTACGQVDEQQEKSSMYETEIRESVLQKLNKNKKFLAGTDGTAERKKNKMKKQSR